MRCDMIKLKDKCKEFMKNDKGVALPIITLLVVFILIGVTVLVIDVGTLYGERRTMVASADAAALAGAKVIEEALGETDMTAAKTAAEKVAKDLAVANGVKNRDDVEISWDRINYNGADRDVITVKVKNQVNLIFGWVWGDRSSGVAAKAVATWGYVLKLEGGNILPIFTKSSVLADIDYSGNEISYLHAGKFVDDMGDVVNGNWGLIDIFGNGGDVSRAFAGELIKTQLEIDITINNQTGLTAGKVAGIETRLQTANALTEKEDRIKYMTALVPVIDFSKVSQQGSSLSLTIEYFAKFEILDVIISEGNDGNKRSIGSQYAMYDTAGDTYLSDTLAKEYPIMDGHDLDKSTIVGRFSDERVETMAVVEAGDQINPNPAIISATYSKLID